MTLCGRKSQLGPHDIAISLDQPNCFVALQEGNFHIIKLLLIFGAEVNALDGRLLTTPLDIAVYQNHEQAIQLLQLLGAVQGESAKTFFNTGIPRLKSFHDEAKTKMLLAKRRKELWSALENGNGNGYHKSDRSAKSDVAALNGDDEVSLTAWWHYIYGAMKTAPCSMVEMWWRR